MRAARATIGGIVGALGFDRAESHGLLPHRWVARGRQRELNIAEHDTRNLVRSDLGYRVVRMIPGLRFQPGLFECSARHDPHLHSAKRPVQTTRLHCRTSISYALLTQLLSVPLDVESERKE